MAVEKKTTTTLTIHATVNGQAVTITHDAASVYNQLAGNVNPIHFIDDNGVETFVERTCLCIETLSKTVDVENVYPECVEVCFTENGTFITDEAN